MNRFSLKMKAKEQLSGNVFRYFLCILIFIAASFCVNVVVGFIFPIHYGANYAVLVIERLVLGVLLQAAILAPLVMGFTHLNLGMAEGNKASFDLFFRGYSSYAKVIMLYLLQLILFVLWSCLFIIPGIIKAYSYSMAYYIMAEHPEMSANEALRASMEMMQGHKWQLFVLELSFILWMLLGSITLGLAYIYIIPYMNLTITNFYNTIKTENLQTESTETQTIVM